MAKSFVFSANDRRQATGETDDETTDDCGWDGWDGCPILRHFAPGGTKYGQHFENAANLKIRDYHF
eukprot:gene17860-5620_t